MRVLILLAALSATGCAELDPCPWSEDELLSARGTFVATYAERFGVSREDAMRVRRAIADQQLDCRPAEFLEKTDHPDGTHTYVSGQSNLLTGVISVAVGPPEEARAIGETALFHEWTHVALFTLHGGDGDGNHAEPDLGGGSLWTVASYQHIHALKVEHHGCRNAEDSPRDPECFNVDPYR